MYEKIHKVKTAKIGIQGGKGSFSEEAANIFVKNHEIDDYEICYLISSKSVLDDVESGNADFGIFAMENAQGGVVIESVEALAAHKCLIIEMFYIPISQNLLSHHGIFMDDITEIHSHQQALRQCREYLTKYFWKRPLVEADDTAEAARRLSEGKLSPSVGVVGSKYCAELYNLNIIEKNIQDLKNNLTLFLGVKKFKEKN